MYTHYTFDNISGNTIINETSNGNAIIQNMTQSGTSKIGSHSIQGTGGAHGIYNLALPSNMFNNDFTMSFWSYFSNITAHSAVLRDLGTNVVFIYKIGNELRYYRYSTFYTIATIQGNQWYHIVLRHNSSANTLDFFLDGTLTFTLTSGQFDTGGPTSNFSIFGTKNGTRWSDGVIGLLDDFRFYTSALSSSEIGALGSTDTTPPTITLTGNAVVNTLLGEPYSDAGATAVDDTDGDITANITTTNTVNVNTVGTYTVYYDVTDAAGNVGTTVTRTVNVIDAIIPVITLLGEPNVSLKVGNSYTDAGATATDNVDGNITANIVTTGTVDTNTSGTYILYYNVSDAAGNAATVVSRTIVVSAVPEVVIEESKPTVDVTSISIVPVAANATAATKRAFTKNAVRNMFTELASQIGNKPVKLAAGSALPGFSEAVAEDVFLYDTRYKTTFEKTEMLNKTFYLASDTNDTITLPTINNSLTVTQNTDDFTIVTPESTVTKVSGDTFIYGGLTLIFGSVYGYLQSDVICFNRGTKITCMNPDTKDDMEVPVEQLREGMYVKTYKHGYIRMKQLASKMIENPETDERSQNRLYICEPGDSFPELTEPLIMTGCHAILVDKINDMQHKTMVELLGSLFLTDEKVRLMCMYDERVYPYCQAGEYEVWHVCLDHYDPNMNYGIYANGLLVESCSERNIYLSSLQKM